MSIVRKHLRLVGLVVGACDTTPPLAASSQMAGEFTWRCTQGRAAGSILLAPTNPPRIQPLKLTVKSR